MQKPFETQPELFVTGAVMNHPSLSGLDGAGKVLDRGNLETLMKGIYGSVAGHLQLEKKNIIMTEGRINIIDATPVEAAQSGQGKNKGGQATKDPEGGRHVKKNSRGKTTSIYGYSVHTAVDEDGFIHRQSVTPGNVHCTSSDKFGQRA
jgi:hypothetical protein